MVSNMRYAIKIDGSGYLRVSLRGAVQYIIDNGDVTEEPKILFEYGGSADAGTILRNQRDDIYYTLNNMDTGDKETIFGINIKCIRSNN